MTGPTGGPACAAAPRAPARAVRLRVLVPLLLIGAVGCVGFAGRAQGGAWLIRTAMYLWIVDDTPAQADAIVVLAGNELRARTAARLWREGWAPIVLVSNCGRSESDLRQVDIYRGILHSEGVPECATAPLPGLARCTFNEASNIAHWADRTGAQTVIVVTDACHTRRSRWLCRNERDLADVRVIAVAAPLDGIAVSDLWLHPDQVDFFWREVLRFAFYWTFWPRGGVDAGIERGVLQLEMPTESGQTV